MSERIASKGISASRLGILTAKLAIAGAVFYWLLRSQRLDLRTLGNGQVLQRGGGLILLAMGSVFVGQVLLAIRLRLLLTTQQVQVGIMRALGLTLLGSMFGAVLPGIVSGDAVKTVYLFSDSTGKRSRAVAAVIADRLIGFYSLFLLASLTVGGVWLAGMTGSHSQILLVPPLALGGLTTCIALLVWLGRSGGMLSMRLFPRLPAKLRNLVAALGQCAARPIILLAALALSLVNHALVIVTFVTAGVLLKDSVTLWQHLMLDPLAMVLNVIPLTPGGIGIAEGGFSFLLAAVGSSNGATIGIFGRVMQYVTFASGGTVSLILLRLSRRPRRQMPSEQVEALVS